MSKKSKNDQCAFSSEVSKPKKKKKSIEIPMPFIPNLDDMPTYIRKDFEPKKTAEDERIARIELMQAISKRDRVVKKLAQLDPGKKKDSKRIVKLNIKLQDLEAMIEDLQKEAGTNMKDLEHGGKWQRRWEGFKKKAHKFWKKTKRWFKENKELVLSVAAVAIPGILGLIFAGHKSAVPST